jgi:hypothetical protein
MDPYSGTNKSIQWYRQTVQADMQAIQQFSVVSGFFQQALPLSQSIQAQFKVISITMLLLVLINVWRFPCKLFEGMKSYF